MVRENNLFAVQHSDTFVPSVPSDSGGTRRHVRVRPTVYGDAHLGHARPAITF